MLKKTVLTLNIPDGEGTENSEMLVLDDLQEKVKRQRRPTGALKPHHYNTPKKLNKWTYHAFCTKFYCFEL